MWCVSHALQIFMCSWKSGICTYRAPTPNPVQHLSWPTLKSEKPGSDLLQENLELYLRVWIVRAILLRARAGMPEQMARRDLRFQSPTPNLLHGFMNWLIWDPSLSCFSFNRPTNNEISQSCGSPVWAGKDYPDPALQLPQVSSTVFHLKMVLLLVQHLSAFGCRFQMASCAPVLYLQEALHALRYLKWYQIPLLRKLSNFYIYET